MFNTWLGYRPTRWQVNATTTEMLNQLIPVGIVTIFFTVWGI